MFIDASAIVSILNREPGYEEIVRRIEESSSRRYVSSLVKFETIAAIARSRSGAVRPTSKQLELSEKIVNDFCERIEAQEINITPHIGQTAIQVARRYSKVVGHEANLNFGDCFAYAYASVYNTRLVYKGNDFSKTDLP